MSQSPGVDNTGVDKAVIARIASEIGAENVISDSGRLLAYEFDGFTIARSTPSMVVFPTTVEQLRRVVRILRDFDVSIVPRGSGTGLAGGCVAFERGVVVSTAKLNRIYQIDLESRVAHVGAGVRNTQLSDAVAQTPGGDRLHFSPDPSSQKASTIGGNAATNAGGVHVLKDFVTSNHVLGVEIVLADASVIRVGATGGGYEAGFDLPGVICGSEGTLGIIASLWVRLSPLPTSFRTIVSHFHSQRDCCNAVVSIVGAGHLPSAMEMLDGRCVSLVEQGFKLGISADAKALLLCEIDGVDELLDSECGRICRILEDNGGFDIRSSGDSLERARLWKARKAAFAALGRITPSYCTQDACVPRSMLGDVLERIDRIGREHGLVINNIFHAGDGNIHPVFLYDDRDEVQVQNVLAAAERVLKYCVDIGGTVTGEHGVGVEKLHLMAHLFDAATLAQMSNVKLAFDPDGRINAGKKLPSEKIGFTLLKPARHVPQ